MPYKQTQIGFEKRKQVALNFAWADLLSAFLLPFIICISSHLGHAQLVQPDTQEHALMVTARATARGTILLRWASNTPRAWRACNRQGYSLSRYTIMRNGQILQEPEIRELGVFLPRPLESWMELIEQNDNMAIMAQALYGETFEVEGMDELSALVNLAEEQEQRFGWGLFAADQDFEVALMAGLGYRDTEVQRNEKYLYKVYPLVPQEEIAIAEGGVYIGLADYQPLPQPLDMAGIFLDGQAVLSWNYQVYKTLYNQYDIERSEDGTTYTRLSELPITAVQSSEEREPSALRYIDSIPNGRTYHYRVRGRTLFGELSPPSEVISGAARPVLAFVPNLRSKQFLDENTVTLHWDFPEEGNGLISEFSLQQAAQENGRYRTVKKEIAPEQRELTYDSLGVANYFILTAHGKQGSDRSSLPFLVQPVDSIPPTVPVGLKGTIDSTGIVRLSWKANPEPDLQGYRIFRGNTPTEEFSQLTISPLADTLYRDTLSLKSLNSKVYYQLIAVDDRFNQSEPSEVLALQKPDLIPPSSPVLNHYEIRQDTVLLRWANSSSTDVVAHELYRRRADSLDWRLTSRLQGTSDSLYGGYADHRTSPGYTYHYTLLAVDAAGLESEPSPPLTVTLPDSRLRPPLQGLKAVVNKERKQIELSWDPYTEPGAVEIRIYKAKGDEKPTLWRTIPSETTWLVDKEVEVNNIYLFKFIVQFRNSFLVKTDISIYY